LLAAATMIEQEPNQQSLTVIVGLGETGWSCARFLRARGIAFAVTDSRPTPPYGDRLRAEMPDVETAYGGFDVVMLGCASRILLSPGVPRQHPLLAAAIAREVPIIGDVELFAQTAKAPVAAVTGSNGKSTVTKLLSLMGEQAGRRVAVGGNLGVPALELCSDPEPDLYVLELSSFQLESIYSLRPAVSVLLNVSPDHMDRYAMLDDYLAAKARVHTNSACQVVNADDPLAQRSLPESAHPIWFTLGVPRSGEFGLLWRDEGPCLAEGGQVIMPCNRLRLKGRHNYANALAALAAGSLLGFSRDAMIAALEKFAGLPHRCQLVASHQGIDWINDSKGTNVGATSAAVDGFADRDGIVLIAGGEGKGADFSPLADAAAGRVRLALLYGRDAPAMERALKEVTVIKRAAGLREAVELAATSARQGEVVLFSPACASFDLFRDYIERGNAFTQAVHEVLGL
jgi:UDP-N-acetylmuramoylalanine--D-glutamate ligase